MAEEKEHTIITESIEVTQENIERGFRKEETLRTMNGLLGAPIAFPEYYPTGLTPVALLSHNALVSIPGKHPDLAILSDIPLNAETPAHLLDDEITPRDKFYVRNNGLTPSPASLNANTWTLTIDGEAVVEPKTYNLEELKAKFKHHTYQLTLECAGNGRRDFDPRTPGNQWSTGAVACAAFTGVRLADVLNDCGITSDALYIGYYSADTNENGTEAAAISRGVPIWKAMEDESLISWAIQDGDLPHQNGYPLRLVFGGWPASCSGKWLQRISVRDKIHDGEKMQGQYYKMPCEPIAPGSHVKEEDLEIIHAMPVKSLITFPRTGTSVNANETLQIRGHAWAGDRVVTSVQCSYDFGMTWHHCDVRPPANKQAWQRFTIDLQFPQAGYYEVWARATDDHGVSQPVLFPGWNPEGYLNNACHRIAVIVNNR